MKALKKLLFITVLMVITHASFAVNYYVKSTGSDSKSGTTFSEAFKTIQKPLDIVNPGDTIFISGGTYFERLVWKKSGTLNASIVMTNLNSDEVIIDGTLGGTNSGNNELLLIESKDYVIVNKIKFTNNYRADARGVLIRGRGRSIKISGCIFTNIGWIKDKTAKPMPTDNANPLLAQGDQTDSLTDISFTFNQVFDCITGYSEGMTVNGNVSDFLIQNNILHDLTNIGIDCAGHYITSAPSTLNQARNGRVKQNVVYNCYLSSIDVASGIYIDGGKDITVEQNRVYNNGTGISVGCENDNKTASNIKVRNNWIYNNIEVGIRFGAYKSTSKVIGSSITNNTFFENYTKGVDGAEIAIQNCENNIIKQNIFVPRTNSVSIGMWNYTFTNLTVEYNLNWRTNGSNTTLFTPNITASASNIFGDPKFAKTSPLSSIDLHIQNGSKAINAGDPNYKTDADEKDIDGDERIQKGIIDIGADETSFVVTTSLTKNENNLNLFKLITNRQNNSVAIVMTNEMFGKVFIFDVKGQILSSSSFKQTKRCEVLLSSLPNGIYFAVIKTNEGYQETKKFSWND
jgi:hypothetical protein